MWHSTEWGPCLPYAGCGYGVRRRHVVCVSHSEPSEELRPGQWSAIWSANTVSLLKSCLYIVKYFDIQLRMLYIHKIFKVKMLAKRMWGSVFVTIIFTLIFSRNKQIILPFISICALYSFLLPQWPIKTEHACMKYM